jgi:hypothetical protein
MKFIIILKALNQSITPNNKQFIFWLSFASIVPNLKKCHQYPSTPNHTTLSKHRSGLQKHCFTNYRLLHQTKVPNFCLDINTFKAEY